GKDAGIRPGMDLGNAAIACLALTDLQLAQSWKAHSPRRQGYAVVNFDPQLERYLETDERGTISVRRVADQAVVLELPGVDVDGQAWFSPNGQYVVARYPQ